MTGGSPCPARTLALPGGGAGGAGADHRADDRAHDGGEGSMAPSAGRHICTAPPAAKAGTTSTPLR